METPLTQQPNDVQIHVAPNRWWRAPRTVVHADGSVVVLSEREAMVFQALVAAAGLPVSRHTLSDHVTGNNPRAVDYAIRRIRTKVEPDPFHPTVVQSVQGIGYRIATLSGSPSGEAIDADQRLILADRWVDLTSGVVSGGAGEQSLTPLQRAVLQRLVEADGMTLSRMTLLQDVWGSVVPAQRRLVDTLIRQLRTLLEADLSRPMYLLTVRGRGYRLHLPSRLSNVTPPLWEGIARPETATVCQLIDSHRWVTIVGPHGCGKSWLARQVALRKRTCLPGGVWWVDVVECTSVDDVVRQLCDVLRVPSQSASSDGAHLRAALAVRPQRLVVLDGLRPDLTIESLLTRLATEERVRVLVTSVRSPQTTDTYTFNLPELEAEPARQLFTARFEAAGGRSQVAPEDVDAVCSAMRFNPSAIGTAAQRAVHHGLVSTQALVDTRVLHAMLQDSLRGAPQGSTHALSQLGAFEGAFTIDDAIAVSDAPASVMQALVERQLLTRPRPGWLRVYGLAADALPVPDSEALRRHATCIRQFFVAAYAQFRTRHGRSARRACQRRLADGLQACRWWLASDEPSNCVELLLALLDCLGHGTPSAFDLLEQALRGPAFAGRDRLWLAYARDRRIDVHSAEDALKRAREEGADTDSFVYRYARLVVVDRHPSGRTVDMGREPQTHPEGVDWLISETRSHARDDLEKALAINARARSIAKIHGDELGLLRADYALAYVWHASMRAPATAAAHFARLRPRFLAAGREQSAVGCAFLAADMWLEVGEVQAALDVLDWVDELAVHLPAVAAMAYPELMRLRALMHTLDPTELLGRTTAATALRLERGDDWFAANFQILTRIAWARLGNVEAATAVPNWPAGHVDNEMVFEALCSAVLPERPVPEPQPAHWPVAQALVAAVRDGERSGTPVVDVIADLANVYRHE